MTSAAPCRARTVGVFVSTFGLLVSSFSSLRRVPRDDHGAARGGRRRAANATCHLFTSGLCRSVATSLVAPRRGRLAASLPLLLPVAPLGHLGTGAAARACVNTPRAVSLRPHRGRAARASLTSPPVW